MLQTSTKEWADTDYDTVSIFKSKSENLGNWFIFLPTGSSLFFYNSHITRKIKFVKIAYEALNWKSNVCKLIKCIEVEPLQNPLKIIFVLVHLGMSVQIIYFQNYITMCVPNVLILNFRIFSQDERFTAMHIMLN